ncbi:hypothetical protein KC799_26610, partial [candidate division KSB1 bacterium]|nr:hypothetical protein [candidate division KSB1 bacterium]
ICKNIKYFEQELNKNNPRMELKLSPDNPNTWGTELSASVRRGYYIIQSIEIDTKKNKIHSSKIRLKLGQTNDSAYQKIKDYGMMKEKEFFIKDTEFEIFGTFYPRNPCNTNSNKYHQISFSLINNFGSFSTSNQSEKLLGIQITYIDTDCSCEMKGELFSKLCLANSEIAEQRNYYSIISTDENSFFSIGDFIISQCDDTDMGKIEWISELIFEIDDRMMNSPKLNFDFIKDKPENVITINFIDSDTGDKLSEIDYPIDFKKNQYSLADFKEYWEKIESKDVVDKILDEYEIITENKDFSYEVELRDVSESEKSTATKVAFDYQSGYEYKFVDFDINLRKKHGESQDKFTINRTIDDYRQGSEKDREDIARQYQLREPLVVRADIVVNPPIKIQGSFPEQKINSIANKFPVSIYNPVSIFTANPFGGYSATGWVTNDDRLIGQRDIVSICKDDSITSKHLFPFIQKQTPNIWPLGEYFTVKDTIFAFKPGLQSEMEKSFNPTNQNFPLQLKPVWIFDYQIFPTVNLLGAGLHYLHFYQNSNISGGGGKYRVWEYRRKNRFNDWIGGFAGYSTLRLVERWVFDRWLDMRITNKYYLQITSGIDVLITSIFLFDYIEGDSWDFYRSIQRTDELRLPLTYPSKQVKAINLKFNF